MSNKTPEMEGFLEDISSILYDRSRKESKVLKKCVTCGGPADEFKDKLSKEEYAISGMCQVCQDEVFG